MAESLVSRPKAVLALGAAVLAMCMAIFAASPPSSQAFVTTVYCDGVTLSGYNFCHGAERSMYAVYGWGEQHAVCVYFWESADYTCSAGPGQGVYDAFEGTYYSWPGIQNNAPGSNTVHGRAYTER
jgi:hypothetical protein